ncbi:Ctr copper transporter [Amylocystis lapponica]|nr:Ctr copper transporter [Amylocystis lapponica]
MMTPYLHFTGGDNLFFKTWTPSSHGAIAGACIGLVALAILERFLGAVRSVLGAQWRQKAMALVEAKSFPPPSPITTPSKEKTPSDIEEVNINSLSGSYMEQGPFLSSRRAPRRISPFIIAHDFPRGVLYALQALLAYVLMLAVMTFQAAFIIAILAGLGVGEVLFGRMGTAESHTFH